MWGSGLVLHILCIWINLWWPVSTTIDSYWVIHYPENPELAALKSCISNPYWTSGCCKVLFNDAGDGQMDGWTLHLEVRNCSSSAVCSHCPPSLDSLRNSGFSPSPSHWKHVLLGWTVFLCSWSRCFFLEVRSALVSFTKPCDIHIYQVLLPKVKKILKLVPWQSWGLDSVLST